MTGRRSTLILAAALVVGVVLGAFVVRRVTVLEPETVVKEFLDAAIAGDFGRAAQIAPPGAVGATSLLTDEVGAATRDRITGYTIDEVDRDDDDAAVTTTISQGDRSTTVDLHLEVRSKTFGIPTSWHLEAPYTVHYVAWGPGMLVNGVLEVPADTVGIQFVALPGTYEITAAADLHPLIAETPGTLQIGLDPEDVEETPRNTTLSQVGLRAVQEAVDDKVLACEGAQADPEPDPLCRFSGADHDETWALDELPVAEVVPHDEDAFDISAKQPGLAQVTRVDVPEAGERPEDLHIGGQIDLLDDGAFTITVVVSG